MSAINDSETDEPTVVTRCDDGENGPPLWKSVRLRICFLCSAGFALVYALRVNLSIAIVAMVRETSHEFVNVSYMQIPFLWGWLKGEKRAFSEIQKLIDIFCYFYSDGKGRCFGLDSFLF